jgi:CRP-like cAMP-binding protein
MLNHRTAIAAIVQAISPVSRDSLEVFLATVAIEDWPKGEVFIQRGKRNDKEYFVLDGICRSFLLDHQGAEVTLSFYASQAVLSPWIVRTQREISTLNFQALTEARLVSFNAETFAGLIRQRPDWRDFGNAVLKNELLQKAEKEIGLAALTAKERLSRLREQLPGLENQVPHSAIASYLGITNVSLSRLRNADSK